MGVGENEEAGLVEQINKMSRDPNWSDHIYHTDELSSVDGTFKIGDVLDKMLDCSSDRF